MSYSPLYSLNTVDIVRQSLLLNSPSPFLRNLHNNSYTPRENDILSLRNINTLDSHLGCVNRLQWNQNGNKLASVSDDTNIIIWTWTHQQGYETLLQSSYDDDSEDFNTFHLSSSTLNTSSTLSSSTSTSTVIPPPPSFSSTKSRPYSTTSKINDETWNDICSASPNPINPMIHTLQSTMHPIAQIPTYHSGNIFSVKFLPFSDDRQLITGSMDGEIRLHTLSLSGLVSPSSTMDNNNPLRSPRARYLYARSGLSPSSPSLNSSSASASSGWNTRLVYEHASRVKGVEVCADSPFIFWSASEDGTVCQYDTREFSTLSSTSSSSSTTTQRSNAIYNPYTSLRPVIISLRLQPDPKVRTSCISVKHLAVSKVNPYHLVIASGDQYLRLYDRRMLPKFSRPANNNSTSDWTVYRNKQDAHTNVLRYAPLHLCPQTELRPSQNLFTPMEVERENKYRKKHWSHATYVDFDTTGRYIIGTYHGDSAYVFDIAQNDTNGEVECYGDIHLHDEPISLKHSIDHGLAIAPSISLRTNTDTSTSEMIPKLTNNDNTIVSTHSNQSSDKSAKVEGQGVSMMHQPLLCSVATQYKDQGNEYFRKENYMEAITWYTKAIEIALMDIFCTKNSIEKNTLQKSGTGSVSDNITMNMTNYAGLALLYANRAQALLKRKSIGDATDAVLDCYKAISYSPHYIKANVRLAKAIKESGHLYLGLSHAQHILSIYNTNINNDSKDIAPLPDTELQSMLKDTQALITEIQREIDTRKQEDMQKEAKQKSTKQVDEKQNRENKRENIDTNSSSGNSSNNEENTDFTMESNIDESSGSSSSNASSTTTYSSNTNDESNISSNSSSNEDMMTDDNTSSDEARQKAEVEHLEQFLARIQNKETTSSNSSTTSNTEESIFGVSMNESSNTKDSNTSNDNSNMNSDETMTSSSSSSSKSSSIKNPSKRRKWAKQTTEEEEENVKEMDSDNEENGAPKAVEEENISSLDNMVPIISSTEYNHTLLSSCAANQMAIKNPHFDYLSLVSSSSSSSSSSSASESSSSNIANLDPDLLCFRHEVRLSGHKNVQTDIKEAVFWGEEQSWSIQAINSLISSEISNKNTQDTSISSASSSFHRITEGIKTGRKGYIVSGSDDGSAYIYDRATGLLVGTVAADSDVCNCVQPHPNLPLLATSGIENVIRLWAPVKPVVEPGISVSVEPPSTTTTTNPPTRRRMGRGPAEPLPFRSRILLDKDILYRTMTRNADESDNDNQLSIPIGLLRSIFQSMHRRRTNPTATTTTTTATTGTTTTETTAPTVNEADTDTNNEEEAEEFMQAILEQQDTDDEDDGDAPGESACRTQ